MYEWGTPPNPSIKPSWKLKLFSLWLKSKKKKGPLPTLFIYFYFYFLFSLKKQKTFLSSLLSSSLKKINKKKSLKMPRPGPRPYVCERRAWHSDRHQPMRGSLIQEIFRCIYFFLLCACIFYSLDLFVTGFSFYVFGFI